MCNKAKFTMAKRLKNTNRKQDDETLVDIVEVRDQAQGFVEENQKLIFGILTVFVVLVGGYFAYKTFSQEPRMAEAIEQMYPAQQQFERDSFQLALSGPINGYPGFLDIIDQYGGTEAGNLALYYAGISYLNLGEYEAAIDYLKDYNADGDITPAMKNGAIGDANSELGNFDEAISSYKKAISTSENGLLASYYMKKLGMLYENQGKTAEALELYNEIKQEHPNSPYAADIDRYISRVQ